MVCANVKSPVVFFLVSLIGNLCQDGEWCVHECNKKNKKNEAFNEVCSFSDTTN